MIYDGTIESTVAFDFLAGRDSIAFDAMMARNDETLRRTTTGIPLLKARTRLVESGRLSTGDNVLADLTVVSYSVCRTYGSLSSFIFVVLGVSPMLGQSPKSVSSTHNKYRCIALHASSIEEVCLICVMDAPCYILIDMGNTYIFFEYEQSTCPYKFLDR
jgi:hypothetical protein